MERKILFLIFIAIVSETIHRIETKQISCEKIGIYDYNAKVASKDCYMDKTTLIDLPNIKIFTRDNSMERLYLANSKEVFYMPDMIGDAYPNLIIIYASNCSIKEIKSTTLRNLAELKELHLYRNQIEKITSGMFKDLKKLKELHLYYNQIETIQSDTFDGLVMLETLALHYNRIKFLNGKAFRFFTKTLINLTFNDCINKTITTNHGPQTLIEITEKCGFVEPKLKKVKPPKMSRSTQILITNIMLAVCAVSICILVGLVLYRKCCHERSLTPPELTQKDIRLADLTISETIITEVKPQPVNDNGSLDSIELISQKLF